MLQDPKSGNWIKITGTADRTMSVTPSDEDGTVIEPYRVYYGDGGEEIDSRFVYGPRQPAGERVIYRAVPQHNSNISSCAGRGTRDATDQTKINA